MPNLIPTAEVARQAGVHPSTITREVARGHLTPAFQAPGPSGLMLFDTRDVRRWLKTRTKESA